MLTTKRLMKMKPEMRQAAILKERIRCFMDYKYMIETYFTVDSKNARKPFILYPHQIKALMAYLTYQNNITMKTRQMGFTTFTSAFIAAELINKNNFKTLVISKEMGSAKDFIKTIKDILDNARDFTRITDDIKSASWLVPEYKEGYNNKESFELTNSSFVKAQGNTEDAGRGIPSLNLAVVDEVAYIDRKSPEKMKEIFAALSPALALVNGRTIMISTPKGAFGWYYDTYQNAKQRGFNVIDAHWTEHPIYNKGQYKWVANKALPGGGELKFFNDEWPETLVDRETGIVSKIDKKSYQFILDGDMRSPWYDNESRKLGPTKTACELDCQFTGTGGEVFEAVILRTMETYAKTSKFVCLYPNGIMTKYKEYFAPEDGGKYVIGSDVATGDGSDFSTVVVMCLKTLRICATLKLQVMPNTLAKIIMQIGKRYNNAIAVVENAGGGGTTLQELKTMGYSNIYYSTLNKKDESLGVKKRKIGLWISEEVRTKGGDKLEEFIRNNIITINCLDLSAEFHNWIWDKDGRRRHAPGKHDDLVMALQHAVYYYNYVYKKNVRQRDTFYNTFDNQTTEFWDTNSDKQNIRGMIATDKYNYNPLEAKRNNGIDIIDQKKNFFVKEPVNTNKRRSFFI